MVVPKVLVGKVLVGNHDVITAGHPGFMRTYSRIREKYFWPTRKKDVAIHVKRCEICAGKKNPPNQRCASLKPIVVNEPLEKVSMDFVSPLPRTKNGNQWSLVLSAGFTHWSVAYALPSSNAELVAQKLVEYVSIYGFPKELLGDRGANFRSSVVKRLSKLLDVKKTFTCSYRPQTNGMCEHLNNSLMDILALYSDSKQDNWDEHLDPLLMAYRTTPHSATEESPAFLMYGREFDTPADLEMRYPTCLTSDDFVDVRKNQLREAYAVVRNRVKLEQERQKKHHDFKAKLHSY